MKDNFINKVVIFWFKIDNFCSYRFLNFFNFLILLEIQPPDQVGYAACRDRNVVSRRNCDACCCVLWEARLSCGQHRLQGTWRYWSKHPCGHLPPWSGNFKNLFTTNLGLNLPSYWFRILMEQLMGILAYVRVWWSLKVLMSSHYWEVIF